MIAYYYPTIWSRRMIVAIGMVMIPAHAQTSAPILRSDGEKHGKIADEVYALSPFIVSSEKDTGYQASSTLAGSRLNTPVKDLGASISIYTKDLMNDIGATNTNDLLIYATGMEAAGAFGNFSGASDDINAPQVSGNGPRVNPQSSSRTRGLAAPNFTRSFFNSVIAMDSYNVESVTVNRGPNAILFGVGSPAGVVESTMLLPDLSQNRNKIDVRISDNSTMRNVIDFNRVLLKKKLAVRLAALHEDERFNQRPSFEKKDRVYGALTYAPYRAAALRMNFESGRATANRPITILPFQSYSRFWLEEGRQGFDWTFYDDPVRNPNARAQIANQALAGPLIGQQTVFDQVFSIYSNPSASAPDMAFRTVTAVTTGNAANAVRAGTINPTVNRDGANDQIMFFVTRNIFELPATFWTASNIPSGQQPGFTPAGLKMQGFTDYSAFDFQHRMIDESSRQGESFHAFNLALEQRVWDDRLGIELVYDSQRVDRRSRNAAFSSNNGNHIRIDPNRALPTGELNPNYGRPFTVAYGQSQWTNNFSDREGLRATAFLKYDFKDLKPSWAGWLGRHALTGLYEENATEIINYRNRLAMDGEAARARATNINVFERRAGTIIYLGSSIIGNANPIQLDAIQVPLVQPGPLAVPAYHFVRQGNSVDPGSFVGTAASLVEINDDGNAQREVIKSQALVLQSYWLKEHLISLIGWRRDEDYFIRKNISYISNPANPNDPGKVHYGFDDFSFPQTPPANVSGETLTYSGVLRWPQGLIRLPNGVDLSAFFNRSSNFTPSGGRVNAFNEPLPSPEGNTRELGLNLSLFHDKLSLRLNFFETKVKGQSVASQVYNQMTNNAVLQLADFWGVEGNVNPHLVAMRNADIDLLFSPLPGNFRSLYGWGISGTAPNLSANGRQGLTGSTDTTDYSAEGVEVDLVYNPTRNWRILVNVAKQETIQSNFLPFTKRFIELMKPVWNQLSGRARNTYPLDWKPGDPMTGIETVGSFIDSVILVPFATALATEGSASAEQRKWRVNLISNYSFGRGGVFGERLKGWGVGGALRWQDKLGVGYPSSRNSDGSVNVDIAHPYYAPAETNVDGWISYERMIFRNRIKWKAQLMARNLVSDNALIPIGVQPWGEYATVRLPPEKRWYLSNTFSF